RPAPTGVPKCPSPDRAPERRHARPMRFIGKLIINLVAIAVLAVGGGLGSAWYMVEAGSRLTTRSFGPWTTWVAAGRPDADPYTRAHAARHALLPIAPTLELSYLAKTDSHGGPPPAGFAHSVTLQGVD